MRNIEDEGLEIIVADDGKTAARMLHERSIDCTVLNPQLPDLSASAFADELAAQSVAWPPAFIIYGEDGTAQEQDAAWKKLAECCPVSRVHSADRLLDQSAFFLHREVAKLPESKRRLLEGLHASGKVLPGKKVLIVDDDMRNIFALSTVLEDQEMVIVTADNGRDAIKILQNQSDIDIVLMDIMMPEMDGIDTMREIRRIPHLKTLPIIAVTAKAMKGDREKCIEAGAWDYLSKPVDQGQLLAVMRAWLHR
jgi:CheY-like chemotaxis protein